MTFINTSPLRISTLATDGVTKTASYYLPPCSTLTLEWVKKSIVKEMIDGSEVERIFGYIPELSCTWSIYDDANPIYGYQIGVATGNQLSFAGLMAVLDNNPTALWISPSLTAGAFQPGSVTVSAIEAISGGMAKNLQITFRGGLTYPTKILGAY